MPDVTPSFHDQFAGLFEAHFPRLVRYLDRLSGEPELADDLAQETFIRLFRRGSLPDAPQAWLIVVAVNLFRNDKSTRSRRRRLLTPARGQFAHSDPARPVDEAAAAEDSRARVRAAIDSMPEREREMLLLRAEGYSYREIAAALDLREASVGTFLARAVRAFRAIYQDAADAP